MANFLLYNTTADTDEVHVITTSNNLINYYIIIYNKGAFIVEVIGFTLNFLFGDLVSQKSFIKFALLLHYLVQ
jgi:hypothetical protein